MYPYGPVPWIGSLANGMQDMEVPLGNSGLSFNYAYGRQHSTFCGDGVVDPREECDPGLHSYWYSHWGWGYHYLWYWFYDWYGNGCVPSSHLAGDWTEVLGDEAGQLCVRRPVCGNGTVEAWGQHPPETDDLKFEDEECEIGDEFCYQCKWIDPPAEASCGNGVLENLFGVQEECDDGNRDNGDGCNWNCKEEWEDADSGRCDDGNEGAGDGCSGTYIETCGNNSVDQFEECDDGEDGSPDCLGCPVGQTTCHPRFCAYREQASRAPGQGLGPQSRSFRGDSRHYGGWEYAYHYWYSQEAWGWAPVAGGTLSVGERYGMHHLHGGGSSSDQNQFEVLMDLNVEMSLAGQVFLAVGPFTRHDPDLPQMQASIQGEVVGTTISTVFPIGQVVGPEPLPADHPLAGTDPGRFEQRQWIDITQHVQTAIGDGATHLKFYVDHSTGYFPPMAVSLRDCVSITRPDGSFVRYWATGGNCGQGVGPWTALPGFEGELSKSGDSLVESFPGGTEFLYENPNGIGHVLTEITGRTARSGLLGDRVYYEYNAKNMVTSAKNAFGVGVTLTYDAKEYFKIVSIEDTSGLNYPIEYSQDPEDWLSIFLSLPGGLGWDTKLGVNRWWWSYHTGYWGYRGAQGARVAQDTGSGDVNIFTAGPGYRSRSPGEVLFTRRADNEEDGTRSLYTYLGESGYYREIYKGARLWKRQWFTSWNPYPSPAQVAEEIHEFDDRHNLTRLDTVAGHVWQFAYDANDDMTSMTDPQGKTTTWQYSAGPLYPSHVTRDGLTWAMEYDEFGGITKLTNPLGEVTTYERDSAGNLTRVKDNWNETLYRASYSGPQRAGNQGQMPYYGRINWEKDRYNQRIEYTYRFSSGNAGGYPVEIVGPNTKASWDRTAAGFVQSYRPPEGYADDGGWSSISVQRDAANRVIGQSFSSLFSDSYTYHPSGALSYSDHCGPNGNCVSKAVDLQSHTYDRPNWWYWGWFGSGDDNNVTEVHQATVNGHVVQSDRIPFTKWAPW